VAAAYPERHIVADKEPEEMLHCSLLLPRPELIVHTACQVHTYLLLPIAAAAAAAQLLPLALHTSRCCCCCVLCSGQVYLLGRPLAQLLPNILRTLLAAKG
jgi:hypothetical protein